jgi:omega-6 fatty acid desaturase (delta-12 desaturase)
MAHEAGHGTLSSSNWVNHLIGYTMHTVRIPLQLHDVQLI